MRKITAIEWHRRAHAAEAAQGVDAARAIIMQGIEQHPQDADLLNSAGNICRRQGATVDATEFFARARQARPDNPDFAINQAIALNELERYDRAVAVLAEVERQASGDKRYCSTRAQAERGAGNVANAARWYDRCLALDPEHQRARHGRARLALERAEPDAAARFDLALSGNSGDVDLWLGKAQALEVEGRIAQAREIAEALVQQVPHWLEGLRFLAQLRLAAGEHDFASHYTAAASRMPDDPNIPRAHIAQLAGVDRFSEATRIAADARHRFPDVPHFALAEAIHAGEDGDNDRAEAIFADLSLANSGRYLHESRHRIRRGEFDHAAGLLDQVLADEPWNVSAWALRDLVWRTLDDERTQWLHGQDGLVQYLPLNNGEDVTLSARKLLGRLHDQSAFPIGQSLRGGTQTRGRLFDRTEPELEALRDAITRSLEQYRAQLPPCDPSHPLLRHRDTPLRLAGSWSVRLRGGGDFHTAHIHPQGILSSALYLVVPEDAGDDRAGWLELGRPPPDLQLNLPPLHRIEPKPDHLALFPSTLYHGTRPFVAAERMTVAFDVMFAGDDFS